MEILTYLTSLAAEFIALALLTAGATAIIYAVSRRRRHNSAPTPDGSPGLVLVGAPIYQGDSNNPHYNAWLAEQDKHAPFTLIHGGKHKAA